MKIKKKFFVFIALVSISWFCFLSHSKGFSAESLITINAERVDLVEVLQSIAKQSEMNLVISKNVSGTTTVKFIDVPLSKALSCVLETNNYFWKQKDEVINVYSYEDTKQKDRFSRVTTRVYTLKHANVADLRRILMSIKSVRGRVELNERANQVVVTDTQMKIEEIETALARLDQKEILKKYQLIFAKAENVKDKLKQVIPDEKGGIFVDERTNSVVVKTTKIVLKDIDELIKGWDVPSRQVFIEAKILQITLGDSSKTGIDWQYLKGKYNLQGQFAQGITTGGIFQAGSLSRRSYEAVLEMLESSSNTDVLSSPRIVVMDNKEASILVGSSEPYLVQQKDTDTGLVTTETKFIDVGIKLRVTPAITDNDFVIMKIHPEVSSARRVAEVDNALAVDTTEADTTMIVKNGNTIILGGLIKDSNVTSVNKIPFLGSIPIVGLFFRSNTQEKVKQEIVVFITPHISNHDNNYTGMRIEAERIEELTKRSLLLRKGFSNDEQ